MPAFQVQANLLIVASDENEAALKIETALDKLFSSGMIGEPEVLATKVT